jgi:superoxide reductase
MLEHTLNSAKSRKDIKKSPGRFECQDSREKSMAERDQILKCDSCGLIAEVVHGSKCEPTCCGSAMKILAENSTDAAKEKHVPVITRIIGGFKVTVGSVLHPMEEKHYIEWIEFIADGISYKAFLSPGMAPTAMFMVAGVHVFAREYCTIHGLWRAET